jgi:hypothetical protein
VASRLTITDTPDFCLEVKRSNKSSIINNVAQHFFAFFIQLKRPLTLMGMPSKLELDAHANIVILTLHWTTVM